MNAPAVIETDVEAVYDAACDRGGLTRRQLLIWAGDRIADGAPVFVEAACFRMRGPLDAGRYMRAFAAMSAESDALCTRIDDVEGWPHRVDDPARMPRLAVVDLTRSPRPDEALADVAREAAWSCARTTGPLVAATLARLGPQDHALVLAQHQLVSDSWAFGVVHDRLVAHYRAGAATPSVAPAPPPQFAEYVAFERGLRASPRAAEARAYWRSAHAETVLRSATAVGPRATRVQRIVHPLGLERSRALRRLASGSPSLDVGLFAVFASAVAEHVHRTSGRRELLLNVPFANRPSARFKQTLGTFMNVCPLRVEVAPADTFAALRARLTAGMWEAARHQGYAGRVAGAAEPYDVLVNVHRSALAGDAFDACAMEVDWVAPTHRYGGLLLAVHDFGATGEVTLVLDLNEATFGPAARSALLQSLLGSLDAQLADPERRLGVARLPRVEAKGHASSDSRAHEPASLWPRLVSRACRTPAATAIRTAGASLSYEALVAGAWHAQRALLAAGVGRGTVVAVWGARGPAWLQAMLGLWARGAVYLPIDPRWPGARIAEVLRQSGAGLIVTGAEPPAVLTGLVGAGEWSILSIDGERRAAGAAGGSDVAARDAAYVIFTSGSTGTPKGALIEHAGLLNHLEAKIALLELGPRDRVAQTASAGFDISLWQGLAPLLVGAEVELLTDDVARDPVALHAALAERRITVVEVVPAVLRALLEVDEARDVAGGRLGNLRWVVVTGEALTPALCRRWLHRYPGIPLVNAYGPTECADDVTHHVIRSAPAADELRTPIGRAIPGVTLHVLDAELQPVADGTPGEICVGGIAVGRGYVNDPARTAAAFVAPDPLAGAPDTRLYRTGDRGRQRPDGTFEWLGRMDAQLKILGTRVEPAEVEAVMAAHPAVREAAVVGCANDEAGTRLLAFAVLEPAAASEGLDASTSAARIDALLNEIRAHVAARLPASLVPSALGALERLPRTPNGKVDYEVLSAMELVPRRHPDPPDTFVEHEVAAMWTRLLGVACVGRDDAFFALGGDSLLAHRMLLDVRGTFAVEIGIDVFLARPTVAGLAAAIAGRQFEGLAADEVEALLDDVEALSDAEAATLLGTRAVLRSSVNDDG